MLVTVLRVYIMVGGGVRGKNIGCLQVSVFDNSFGFIHQTGNFF